MGDGADDAIRLIETEWALGDTCPGEDYHDCDPCPECQEEYHRFTHEPYCDRCGIPYGEWFNAISNMIGK